MPTRARGAVGKVGVSEGTDHGVTLNVAVVVVQAEGIQLAFETHQPSVVLIAVGGGVVHVLTVQRQRQWQVGDVDLTKTFIQAEFAGAVAIDGQCARRGFGASGRALAVIVVFVAIHAAAQGYFEAVVGCETCTQLAGIHAQVVTKLHTFAVDVVL